MEILLLFVGILLIILVVSFKNMEKKKKRQTPQYSFKSGSEDTQQLDKELEEKLEGREEKSQSILVDEENGFVAIDFETATGKRNSACQLGIVLVESGEIRERKTYLIQPPNNEYSAMNTRIHGLSYKKTVDAPTFVELWHDIKPYINNYPIVCHNESFDIDVLKKTCDYYSISDLSIQKVTCTYRMTGLALVEACQGYGIDVVGHHDALADAEMCANVYLKILQGVEFNPSIVYVRKGGRKESDPELVETVSKRSCGYFVDKGVVITGVFSTFSRDDLKEVLCSQGAIIKSSITSKVDVVVMGQDAGPSKCAKISELKGQGKNIEVLNESDLLGILNIERRANC